MTSGTSRNQTQAFLMRRFAEAGIEPRTRFGQNFLVDGNLQRLLLRAAHIDSSDVVLEVGTGTGALTALLAQEAAFVVTVEVDHELFRLAEEELDDVPNLRMLRMDALETKNRLNPEVLQAVASQLSSAPGRCFKLVANLPFNVATPVLSNLLTLDRPPKTMTATIQKELADRIVARPATKDYGALSVWVQCQCQVRIVRVLPPSVFWPRPKVHSAIVQVTFDPALRQRIADRDYFHSFVRSMFFHRRKLLRSELLSAFKSQITKPEVDRILSRMGFDATVRAEQLDVDTMIALADLCRMEIAGKGE
jgi:16S rRNA (adenine1518-N6/adenine1519-N6)-dimethyltransferase